MEFVIADNNLHDVCILPDTAVIDMDIGDRDDFELILPLSYLSEVKAGFYMYCLGTEFGGKLKDPTVDSREKTVTFSGTTWRGMLKCRCTDVPGGSDHAWLSGGNSLYETTRILLNEHYSNPFVSIGDRTDTWGHVGTIPRYYTIYDTIDWLYDKEFAEGSGNHFNIVIRAEYNEIGHGLQVNIKPEPFRDFTEIYDFSNNLYDFKFTTVTSKYTYVLALGKGEMRNRTVVKMRVDRFGKYKRISEFARTI